MNTLKCSVCSFDNFILDYKCINCGTIIREKVTSINLGDLLKDLLFNVDFAIKRVLYAEHKTYLFVILLVSALKFTILTLINISFIDLDTRFQSSIFVTSIFVFWCLYFLIISFLFGKFFQFITRIKLKFKTTLTLILFPLTYFSISIFLFFPVELMLFGKYLFSNNPSIFEINFSKALAIIILESVVLLYSLFLLFKSLVFILHKNLLSFLLMAIIFICIISGNKIFQIIIGIN